MKTIADFKRNVKVGAKVHTIYHQASNGRDEKGIILYKDEDKGVREISVVQSTKFAVKTELKDGTFADSWLSYPKASECIFNQDGSITICERDFRLPIPDSKYEDNSWRDDSWRPLIPILTYKFV